MAKFCTNCGNELADGADVCVKCGAFVKKSSNNNNAVESADRNANTGLILGLISILAWFIPLFGYPVTICGIVYSSKGLKSATSKGKAIAGLVLSILFLIVTLINSYLGVMINLGEL